MAFNIIFSIRGIKFINKALIVWETYGTLLGCFLSYYRDIKPIEHRIIIILGQTSEIGQGLGRFLSCGARKPEQT